MKHNQEKKKIKDYAKEVVIQEIEKQIRNVSQNPYLEKLTKEEKKLVSEEMVSISFYILMKDMKG